MPAREQTSRFKKAARSTLVEWAASGLTVLSSIALSVLLFATFAGVVMRYVFNAPILGGNEIVQLTSVALVMLALPVAAHHETHIKVDVFDALIGSIGRFIGDIFSRAIAAYVLGLLTKRAWAKMFDAVEYGDATNMLAIPLWPFYALIVFGAAAYACVLVLQLLDVLWAGPKK